MTWVDSHCHLHLAAENAAVLLDRATALGVDWVVCPGTDADGSEAARRLAETHSDRVSWTAGLHPHEADRWPEEGDRIADLAAEAAGIGEIGLDFYRDLSPRHLQVSAFRAQVELGLALGKPLVVHTRDSFSEVFDILEDTGAGPSTVLHCWTGGRRWTRRFGDLGVHFSFAGPITFAGGETVRLAAAEAPAERTMVETDTPYLTPPPNRRAPNEPANVVTVGRALAEVWGLGVGEVAALTSAAAARVFGRA